MVAPLGAVIEPPGKWECSWCHTVNVRQYVGLDHCSNCHAAAMTEFTGIENEIRVAYTKPPSRTIEK